MEFQSIIQKYKNQIDSVLEEYLKEKFSQFPAYGSAFIKEQFRLAQDLCLSDGKRLRPILTIMAYRAVGGKNEAKTFRPALAFEIYHNYTLIHDDIYDEDSSRRGRTTNHAVLEKDFSQKYPDFPKESLLYRDAAARFGVVGGIINGKYLHTLSSLPIFEAEISAEQKVAGLMLHQMVSIADNTGQAIDLDFEPKTKVSEQNYYDMVMCKTGRLFQASVEWGAILGDATMSQRKALREFVGEAAIAFQIRDDMMDIEEGTKGRGLGSDIRQRKKTLLVIHLLKNAGQKEKVEFLEVFGKKDAKEAEIKRAIGIMKKCGSIRYCEAEAKKRINKAVGILGKANPALRRPEFQFFSSLSRFMLKRKK